MTTTPIPFTLTSYTFASEGERESFRRDRLDAVATFLHAHLGPYGDPLDQIRSCLERACGARPTDGGSVTLAVADDQIVGAVVTNDTHMSGYTPENLLVYIATHEAHRGSGIGRALMERVAETVEGAIALHVEKDNPASKLYEKLGYTNKYLEMRLQR